LGVGSRQVKDQSSLRPGELALTTQGNSGHICGFSAGEGIEKGLVGLGVDFPQRIMGQALGIAANPAGKVGFVLIIKMISRGAIES